MLKALIAWCTICVTLFFNILADCKQSWDSKQSISVHGCRRLLRHGAREERHFPLPTYLHIFQTLESLVHRLGPRNLVQHKHLGK